jgi:hypothetical protein
MKTILAIFALLFSNTACSTVDKPTQPTLPTITNVELRNEITRIEPQLLFCDGEPVPPGNNAVTGRPNCNSGDSMLIAGLYYSSKPLPEIATAIKDSFAEDGQPYRSPEHKRGKDSLDAFSRDQTLGFLSYCLNSKDFETCNTFYQYIKANDYKACPKDSDGRCNIYPSVMFVLGSVWGANGWSIPPEANPSQLERAIDEKITREEAATNKPGFRVHLVSLKLWLRGETGTLTNEYRKAIRTLAIREPNNLWYMYLDTVYNNGPESLESISTKLLEHMKAWNPNGNPHHWSWAEQNRHAEAMGHDYIFLAEKLLKKE